jgi:hypothetical protein
MVLRGVVTATRNAIVPLTLVLFDRANLSPLFGNPPTTPALYAVVFAGNLLLATGLIVLAFKRLSVERDMLARLDRGASQHLARAREMRARRDSRRPRGELAGHDIPMHARPLPSTI